MIKVFVINTILCILTIISYGQNRIATSQVPMKAKEDLLSRYTIYSEVLWYKDSQYFFSKFTIDNKKFRIKYNSVGNWIETWEAVKKLPTSVMDSIRINYSLFKIETIEKGQTLDYSNIYSVIVKNKEKYKLIYHNNGVLLHKEFLFN